NGFQLRGRELKRADPIGRDLKTVLHKGDHPTEGDCNPERRLSESQVPVPRKGHEYIRDSQQNYRSHFLGSILLFRHVTSLGCAPGRLPYLCGTTLAANRTRRQVFHCLNCRWWLGLA